MKKIKILFIMLAIFSIAFTSCKKDEEETPTPTPTTVLSDKFVGNWFTSDSGASGDISITKISDNSIKVVYGSHTFLCQITEYNFSGIEQTSMSTDTLSGSLSNEILSITITSIMKSPNTGTYSYNYTYRKR
jgi:hypothetical protein